MEKGERKIFGLGMREKRRMRRHFLERGNVGKRWWWRVNRMGIGIVVTTGIKQSSNISSALVSAMYDRSSELGLYQTYTSAHPFDTLVAGFGIGGTIDGSCEP